MILKKRSKLVSDDFEMQQQCHERETFTTGKRTQKQSRQVCKIEVITLDSRFVMLAIECQRTFMINEGSFTIVVWTLELEFLVSDPDPTLY